MCVCVCVCLLSQAAQTVNYMCSLMRLIDCVCMRVCVCALEAFHYHVMICSWFVNCMCQSFL